MVMICCLLCVLYGGVVCMKGIKPFFFFFNFLFFFETKKEIGGERKQKRRMKRFKLNLHLNSYVCCGFDL